MKRILGDLRDRFFGRGSWSITLPPMDGVLRPNEWLESAPVLTQCPEPDHLVGQGDTLWLTSAAHIYRVQHNVCTLVATCRDKLTAFARSTDDRQASATRDGVLDFPVPVQQLPEGALRCCITGLAFDPGGGCFLTVGSAHNPADAWQKDLLERHASGSLWHISSTGLAKQIADGLAWPQSPLAEADGSVVISESSASRLVRFTPEGQHEIVLTNLPGYPAGMAHTGSGYALCIKAPRSQLIEFILREPEFCAQMIRKIPPEYWIAPSLHPPQSFLEPLQGGALKQLGRIKPWAPSRSCGLVVELDPSFVPLRSYHSRANGTRHGTASCTVLNGKLVVASIGAGCILTLNIASGEQA